MAIINGTPSADAALTGTGTDDRIAGLAGDDSITGGAGNDVIGGEYLIVVKAWGNAYLGLPHMVVSINGVDVAEFDVSATSAATALDYHVGTALPPASIQNVSVRFTNDAYGGAAGDRNLFVSSVTVGGVVNSTPSQTPLPGSPGALVSNGSVVYGFAATPGAAVSGNDTLDGGAGADSLYGGAGNDTYVVDQSGDVVVELANEGVDTVQSTAANHVLAPNVENLVVKNLEGHVATGNGLDNLIQDSDAYSTLLGMNGNDRIQGNGGTDFILGGQGHDSLEGGGDADWLVGESGVDTLLGGDGNDFLNGGLSESIFITAFGDQTDAAPLMEVYVNGQLVATRAVTATAAAPQVVKVDTPFTLHAIRSVDVRFINDAVTPADRNLYVTAVKVGSQVRTAPVQFTPGSIDVGTVPGEYGEPIATTSFWSNGSATFDFQGVAILNDSLSGTSPLIDRVSADSMVGGAGDDVYFVDSLNDIVVEAANGGIDKVYSAIDLGGKTPQTTLHANVEAAELLEAGGAKDITGNDQANDLRGNGLNNVLLGGQGADTLQGRAGNDILQGGEGNDALSGGEGDDFLSGGSETAQVTIKAYADFYFAEPARMAVYVNGALLEIVTVTTETMAAALDYVVNTPFPAAVISSVEVKLFEDKFDIATSEDLNLHVVSVTVGGVTAGQPSVVTGPYNGYGGGQTTLGGGQGSATYAFTNVSGTLGGPVSDDVMEGGAGDDVYVVDSAMDVIAENADLDADGAYIGGRDKVFSSVSHQLSAGVEDLTLLAGAAVLGTGNASDNTVIGNGNANQLQGFGGADILDGRAGADTLTGGTGDDTYVVDNVGDQLVENADEGVDTVVTSLGITTLAANFENLTLAEDTAAIEGNGNDGANVLTGNKGANRLSGGLGDDTLAGGGGQDTLTGGGGSDLYLVTSNVSIVEAAGGGDADQVLVSSDGALRTYTLADHVEIATLSAADANGDSFTLNGNASANTLYGSFNGDSISGAGGDDIIDGGFGNDTLAGGIGADLLMGGYGNDLYHVADGLDTLYEGVEEGTDTVRVSNLATYTLGDDIENGEINAAGLGTTRLTLNGNGLDNRLTGSTNNDSLTGFAGNDTIDGLQGHDHLFGGDGDDSLSGGLGNDYLTGDVGNDWLDGGDGTDVLDGLAGVDTLRGGTGDDAYYLYYEGTHLVVEGLAAGNDSVYVIDAPEYTLAANIEYLSASPSVVIGSKLTGNDLANTLDGSSFADTLIGGLGNDTLIANGGADSLAGGQGDDTYRLQGAAAFTLGELAGEGLDTVELSGARSAFTLAANIEVLNASAVTVGGAFTGNEGFGIITGTAFNDTILGLGDNDNLYGGGGADTLDGGDGADALYGDVGRDKLTGGNGVDLLDGGTDIDTMEGGAGGDLYYVDHASDVIQNEAATAGEIDTVISTVTRSLETNVENLTLAQGAATALNAVGNDSQNILIGNDLANSLKGLVEADRLSGGGGDDTLYGDSDWSWFTYGATDTYTGGAGTDTLYDHSNSSNDVYNWSRGEGADTLLDAGGTSDLLQIGGAVATQVWFTRSGKDMQVSLIGTTDSFTVRNWYAGTTGTTLGSGAVDRLTLSAGTPGDVAITAASVQTLVNAMAGMTRPTGTSLPTGSPYNTLATSIASAWTA